MSSVGGTGGPVRTCAAWSLARSVWCFLGVGARARVRWVAIIAAMWLLEDRRGPGGNAAAGVICSAGSLELVPVGTISTS